MNLNPLSIFRRGKSAGSDGGVVHRRPAAPEGPYTTLFNDWVPRTVNPHLYEAIREAVAPIDGAINRLVTLDGIIRVEGESDRLVSEIEDWAASVPVNDLETGLQAFYRSQGNELYEQGFTIGDPVLEKGDVIGLRVADSKGVFFRRAEGGGLETWYAPPRRERGRRDGTDQIERVLRNSYRTDNVLGMLAANGYRQIAAGNLVYACFNPEADVPYGVSLMRSTEFDSRVLLVMKNALYRTWERFGDPAFNVVYKTNARVTQSELDTRKATLAKNLADAMNIKRSGNSADFVNAVGKDDTIEVTVLGADGQALEIEMPARHILENIVSKTGLPSWMLGFHWSTAERLAQRQGEIALQESKTRFETRRPGLRKPVEMMLRARGRSWKRGDWELVQDLPSLQDLVAQAQAVFLYTQSAAVMAGAGISLEEMERIAKQAGIGAMLPDEGMKALGQVMAAKVGRREGEAVKAAAKEACGCEHHQLVVEAGKSAGGKAPKGETYVEDAEALMGLERATERALLAAWDGLYTDVVDALELDKAKSAKGRKEESPVFMFDPAIYLPALEELEESFIAAVGGDDAALAANTYRAWLRGVANAAEEFEGVDAVVATARESMRRAVEQAGMEQVRNTTVRALREDIIEDLASGAFDGQNPLDVARALRKRFEAHEYDWERLARSEIAQAQAQGKLSQYAAHDVTEYDWVAAGNSCLICKGKEAAGPYTLGAGPVPMQDSHPNCRCTVVARVE